MKLKELFEGEFDNAEVDVYDLAHIQNIQKAVRKEIKATESRIHTVNDDIIKLVRITDPDHAATWWFNKERASKTLGVASLISQHTKLCNRVEQLTNQLDILKRQYIVTKYPTEDTSIDPAIGIPNPTKLSLWKGGPANIVNPYFHKYKDAHGLASVYARAATNDEGTTINQQKQYRVLSALLSRHQLPGFTRVYGNRDDFYIIGNNGDFIWTIADTGQGKSNYVYIKGHKYNTSALYDLRDDLLKMDHKFSHFNKQAYP